MRVSLYQDDIYRRWPSLHVRLPLTSVHVRLTQLPDSGFKFAELEMSMSTDRHSDHFFFHSQLFFHSEVVLSLLIESFRFTPSNKDIFWQMTSVATPSVAGEGGKLQLPLQVSRVLDERRIY
jgi:hypothetical protein